jgi:hypothetical protein
MLKLVLSRTRHAKGSLHERSLLLALAGILALSVAPGPTAAAPGADLKVRSVEIENPDPSEPLHMFYLRNGSLKAHVRVKNVGNRAGGGRGVLKVLGNGALGVPTEFEFSVPKLKPGKSKVIDLEILERRLAGTNDYATEACVGNSCKAGAGFAVIPRKWKGTTESEDNDNGIVSTCETDPTFTYNQASGAGKFFYTGAGGHVTCTASGSRGGCTYSGQGQEVSTEQILTTLSISSSLDTYNAVGASSKSYEALKECPPDPPQLVDIDVGAWLVTGNKSMESFDTTLSGSLALKDSTWSWNLTAD